MGFGEGLKKVGFWENRINSQGVGERSEETGIDRMGIICKIERKMES